jgi:hypothetical protein
MMTPLSFSPPLQELRALEARAAEELRQALGEERKRQAETLASDADPQRELQRVRDLLDKSAAQLEGELAAEQKRQVENRRS